MIEYSKREGEMKMKNKMKKITMVMMVMILGLIGLGGNAFAYSGTTSFEMNSPYGGTAYIHTNDTGSSNVASTFEPAYNNRHYITLSTQRNRSGVWMTIESKSGWAEWSYGSKTNFNATFYNYGYTGEGLRVRAQIRETSGGPIIQTVYSKSWIR